MAILQGFLSLHTTLHTCGGSVTVRHIWRHFALAGLWTTLCTEAPLYWPSIAPNWGNFLSLRPREKDVPAQRAPAEAQARLSCPHVDARRPRDFEAPPRAGPEASFRVTRCSAGIACLARETSTPSTGTGVRRPHVSSFSTGSSETRTVTSPVLASRCPKRSGTRWRAIGSSGSFARRGASDSTPSPRAATTF
jgi:hypothetical protein